MKLDQEKFPNLPDHNEAKDIRQKEYPAKKVSPDNRRLCQENRQKKCKKIYGQYMYDGKFQRILESFEKDFVVKNIPEILKTYKCLCRGYAIPFKKL